MGFASIFVLGRAGEPVRPLLLARKDRLPVASMFGIFFLERFCDFAAAAVLACLSLLVFPNRLSDAGADMNWVDSARHGGWLLLAAMSGLIAILVYYRLHGAGALDRGLERWRTAGGMRMPLRLRDYGNQRRAAGHPNTVRLAGGHFLHGGALDPCGADLPVGCPSIRETPSFIPT